MGKNPFFNEEDFMEESTQQAKVTSSENAANEGSRLPRKSLPGTRRAVVIPGQGGLTPVRRNANTGSGVSEGDATSVPSSGGERVSPSVQSASGVEGSSPDAGTSRRERPRVVMPPSSGVRKPLLSEQEREKLGARQNKGVVLPPSARRESVGEDVFDDVFSVSADVVDGGDKRGNDGASDTVSVPSGEGSAGRARALPSPGAVPSRRAPSSGGREVEASVPSAVIPSTADASSSSPSPSPRVASTLPSSERRLPLPGRSGGKGGSALPDSGVAVSVAGKGSLPVAETTPSESTPSATTPSGGSSLPGRGRGMASWNEDEAGEFSSAGEGIAEGEDMVEVQPVKVRAPKSAPTPRAVALADVDDNWDDVEDEEEVEPSYRDTVLEASANKGIRIMDRDVQIFNFLGRYRYAQDVQIARLVSTSDKAAYIRLSKLAQAGLVKRHEIARGHTVWSPLKGAMAIAELDFPVISAGRISLTTMGHELGLANLGVELETGQANVLKEEGWPFYNKYALEGDLYTDEMLLGENVFTTREIRSSQTRWNAGKSASQLIAERDELLRLWQPGERSPETLPENAGMFVLYSNDYKDHVPDMVVARDRSEDGSANSIAIELELNAKPLDEWRRILKNYRDYVTNGLFHSVYYFTQRKAINDTLRKLNANEIGIPEDRFKILRYSPRNGGQLIWG